MQDTKPPEPPVGMAASVLTGDTRAIDAISSAPLLPLNDNLVSRPWAGQRLSLYKRAEAADGQNWGEAFELCAHDTDPEASAHPSSIRLTDGSLAPLPGLLAAAGPQVLGEAHMRAHGPNLPLLPKTLDVGELLSIQAHPEGSTEAYIIVQADEGATIRLGFRQNINPQEFGQRLSEGLELQQRLLGALRPGTDQDALQAVLKGYFAEPDTAAETVLPPLEPMLSSSAGEEPATLLRALKDLYWDVLNLMNEIEVSPGMVIHNANPPAVAATSGRKRSAEIHALGNPEGREILALEVRSPAPTYRAWDNVRFPVRPVDVATTLDAVNLEATRPADFIVTPEPLEGHPGVFRSVADPSFIVHHLRPRPGKDVTPPDSGGWHTLHCIDGSTDVVTARGDVLATLERGQSALIPVSMETYRLVTTAEKAEVLMVNVP